MCGRYVSVAERTDLIELYNATAAESSTAPASYNVAPTQNVTAVIDRLTTSDDDGVQRSLRPLKWGLVPFWANDPKIGSRMINARVETLAEIIWGQPVESPIQPGCRFLAREGRPLAGRKARAEAVLVVRGR
jgi:putative SOS response-associated peptidase YedK